MIENNYVHVFNIRKSTTENTEYTIYIYCIYLYNILYILYYILYLFLPTITSCFNYLILRFYLQCN